VSPNSWNLDRSPRKTPAVTGPECSPIRMVRSPVSGPSVASSVLVNVHIFRMQSLANRAIVMAEGHKRRRSNHQ
jgi:hypothetical protein